MNRKRWVALAIAAVLLIISVLVEVIGALVSDEAGRWSDSWLAMMEAPFSEEVVQDGDPLKKIAVLEVNGVIEDAGEAEGFLSSPLYHHQTFLRMIEQAQEDEDVKAIVLRINSPGGGVAESAEIHDQLLKLKKKTNKPIYVSMGAMAASGGYYIATAGDKIFASPETITGSIGVIMQSVNYEKLAKKYGVELVTIKSGPYKDLMNPARSMTEAERDILQRLINNSYEAFVDVVANGRKLPENVVRKLADGRIYDGRQAKSLHLIDEFGYFDDVIAALKREHHLKGAQVVKYATDTPWSSLFGLASARIKPDSGTLEIARLLSRPSSPRLMYLYAE
ncbi:signal peptide peptidase SppA [Geobacillus sp. YF-1]|uniref:signal peptide peptidase SppA n=1 Tax=Geobacillus sp. YF-1 TaxID=3457480 RepID=UPI00404615D5